MARKSRRMALYEAIRQGQANIAKGLETGQMRSDRRTAKKERDKNPDRKALLKTKERTQGIRDLSRIWAVTAGFTIVVILVMVIWFVINLASGPEPDAAGPGTDARQGMAQEPGEPADQDTASGLFGGDRTDEPTARTQAPQAQTQPSAAPGQNVIVIQQVPGTDRRQVLEPVQAYFNEQGIPTEMIQRSGYTLLVTRAGFDYNPNRQGTEGHRLLQRIRQVGSEYPQATGDTKFGARPFQDAYPFKK